MHIDSTDNSLIKKYILYSQTVSMSLHYHGRTNNFRTEPDQTIFLQDSDCHYTLLDKYFYRPRFHADFGHLDHFIYLERSEVSTYSTVNVA